MRVAKMLFALGGAAAVAGATAAVAVGTADANVSHAVRAPGTQAPRPNRAGPAAADRAALSYVAARYRGPATAHVLAAEKDTERGQPAYDIRVLAANGTTYVVHVSRASNRVLGAHKAESQAGARAAAPPEKSSRGDR